MILVVGSIGSGKRDYARSLGYSDEAMTDRLEEKPVLYDLQELVRNDPDSAPQLLPRLLNYELVLCDEVGAGIIPMGRENRAWREATGRLCCQLAKQAEKVVRLCCGIPTVIKE